MKIKGFVRKGHAYVPTVLICDQLGIWKHVVFLIDTGADKTTLFDTDIERLGLDYGKLEKAEAVVAFTGTKIDVYKLPNVLLAFKTEEEAVHLVRLDEVEVVKGLEKQHFPIPISLMGMDVLSKFRIRLHESEVELEI